jgi:hypothetical protein
VSVEHVARMQGAAGHAGVVPRGNGVVIAVADGGSGRGARAAELAVARLAAAAQQRELDPTAAVKALDPQLAVIGGEASVVALAVSGREVRGASVGDCAAWIVAPDGAVEMLTARQHRKPLVGGGATVLAFHASFTTGTLIVATDGLFAHASTGRITAACTKDSLDAVADALIAAGLADDIALVVCRRT